jgi:ribonuclease HI
MVKLFTDGATRPTNPGPSGYGYVVQFDEDVLATGKGYLGDFCSNNQAEYAALLAGLGWVLEAPIVNAVEVCADSLLVLNQVQGIWHIRAPKLGPLYSAIKKQLETLTERGVTVTFAHVRGHTGVSGNELADREASLAIDEKTEAPIWIMKLMAIGIKLDTAPRGHEKLMSLVVDHFENRWVKVSPNLSLAQRALINRTPTPTGSLLSQFPQLALIGSSKVVLLSLATGFKKSPGQQASRTIDLGAFQVAKSLADSGYDVVIIHKPHGHGVWVSFNELGWGSDTGEANLVVGWVDTMRTGREFSQDGWPPSVEILGPWLQSGYLERWV